MNLYRKIAFLMGQVGLMMLARYFFQWITKFCTESAESLQATAQAQPSVNTQLIGEALDPISRICGVSTSEAAQATLFSVSLVGAILMIFRIFDGVTDPLAGGLSDWWVRQGRQRRSLLWYSFWIAPIGLILCFAPTYEMNVTLRWTLLVGGMFVFFVGYTLYCIPYWSLISDYAGDHERDQQVLSTLLGAGILIATGLGFVVSPILIESLGYGQSAWCFALIAAPLMVLPYFAAPPALSEASASSSSETLEPTRKPAEGSAGGFALTSSLKRTFNNHRFLSLMFLFAGSQMSLTIMTAAAPFIAEGLLNESKEAVPLLMGPFLLMTLLSFPLVPWISRRLGWERAMMWASIGLSSVYLLTGTLGAAWLGSPLTTAMIIFAVAGPFVGVLLGLEGEAITHCAQDDGAEYVSIYWGVFNLVVKSLNGLALWMSAMIAARICPLREGFWGQGILGDETWTGVSAVRSMGMSAGLLLLVGVLGYLWVKRARQSA